MYSNALLILYSEWALSVSLLVWRTCSGNTVYGAEQVMDQVLKHPHSQAGRADPHLGDCAGSLDTQAPVTPTDTLTQPHTLANIPMHTQTLSHTHTYTLTQPRTLANLHVPTQTHTHQLANTQTHTIANTQTFTHQRFLDLIRFFSPQNSQCSGEFFFPISFKIAWNTDSSQ